MTGFIALITYTISYFIAVLTAPVIVLYGYCVFHWLPLLVGAEYAEAAMLVCCTIAVLIGTIISRNYILSVYRLASSSLSDLARKFPRANKVMRFSSVANYFTGLVKSFKSLGSKIWRK